jgi:hypothetical protein
MSSRDGLHWYRFREAFIRPTRERNTWTDRTNGPAWGILQTGPEELSVYWVDHFHHPTNRLSRGTLRLDGFASLTAPFAGGEMVTKPLRFEGRELVLNYETSGAGSVRVEIQDENGVPIPGYTLIDHRIMYGNEIEGVVNWQRGSNVASLAGRPVRLRFVLSDADVYALQFRSAS